MRRSTWAPLACAILLACPAVAAADTKVSFNDGELSVVNEDAGIANKMSVEYATHNGEPSIRLFDDADPAGMATFPTPPCSPGQVNARGNPVELFCTRSAIRAVSIDIGPNEDGVTYKLDETPGVVTGGLGTDVLTTAGSNDLVGGDQGNDTLDSGAGDDDVRGGEGADTLSAGPGNDKILGGPDADTIDAGDGDDALNTADGVADKVACGPGNDSVTADTLDELADCENVQRWPARSSAVYWRSPNGKSVGAMTIRAPSRSARSRCASAFSTRTMTEPPRGPWSVTTTEPSPTWSWMRWSPIRRRSRKANARHSHSAASRTSMTAPTNRPTPVALRSR